MCRSLHRPHDYDLCISQSDISVLSIRFGISASGISPSVSSIISRSCRGAALRSRRERSAVYSQRDAVYQECVYYCRLALCESSKPVSIIIDIRFLNLESINLRIDLSLERMDPLESFLASSSNKRGLKYSSDNNCNNFL